MTQQKTLVVTGGGTAGHVWPNFALLEDVKSPLGRAFAAGTLRVVYIGSEQGMERQLVERYAPQWTYIGIQTGKLRRYFSWQNFIDPFRIVLGFFQAIFAIRKVKASVLFSKGGFVSAPVVWAAWLLRVPVVIHESDVTPALATKLTLPFCNRAITAFAETANYTSPSYRARILPLGIPIRPSLLAASRTDAVAHFKLNSDKKTILIFGGSLGADGMNKKLTPALAGLSQKYNIIHICGKDKLFAVPDATADYKQFEFLKEDMALAYAATDVAICRAGASSIFELAALRIPMILIPLGLHQSRGDQIVNAKIFESRGWAQQIEQESITKDNIVAMVEQTMTQLEAYRQKLSTAPRADAVYEIGAQLLALAK